MSRQGSGRLRRTRRTGAGYSGSRHIRNGPEHERHAGHRDTDRHDHNRHSGNEHGGNRDGGSGQSRDGRRGSRYRGDTRERQA
ncbi:hypothetical protein ABH927_003701 [Planotetraspora sp. GP83]